MPFVDHMQRNRFELKYLIDERLTRSVRDFARRYMIRDPHARPDMGYCYPIFSIYLDSPALTIFNTTMEGRKNRFKLRIRYYNDKPTSPVFFETKRRVDAIILKERSVVKRASVYGLLGGRPPERTDLVDEHDPEAYINLCRFCELQRVVQANGRAIVAYTREAWNVADNDDVRLTFDRDIKGAWFNDSMTLAGKKWRATLLDPGIANPVVLELKFTGRFPNWMRELVTEFDLWRTSVAKYVHCVNVLGPRGSIMTPSRRAALSVEQASRLDRLLPLPRGPIGAPAGVPGFAPEGRLPSAALPASASLGQAARSIFSGRH